MSDAIYIRYYKLKKKKILFYLNKHVKKIIHFLLLYIYQPINSCNNFQNIILFVIDLHTIHF